MSPFSKLILWGNYIGKHLWGEITNPSWSHSVFHSLQWVIHSNESLMNQLSSWLTKLKINTHRPNNTTCVRLTSVRTSVVSHDTSKSMDHLEKFQIKTELSHRVDLLFRPACGPKLSKLTWKKSRDFLWSLGECWCWYHNILAARWCKSLFTVTFSLGAERHSEACEL